MNRPPVQGLPAERPLCGYCGKKIKFYTEDKIEVIGAERRIVERRFTRFVGYPRQNPIFCTLRCSLDFAVAAWNINVRMKGRG